MKLLICALLFPVLAARAQSVFDIKIAQTAKQLACSQPTEQDPVSVSAQLVIEGDSIAVIVKTRMAPGWHIYAYVPQTQPYLVINQLMQLPENIKSCGNWINTEPAASSDYPGVLIYDNEAIFIHKLVKLKTKEAGGKIKAGLYYQTCNMRQCLQPAEKTFDLEY